MPHPVVRMISTRLGVRSARTKALFFLIIVCLNFLYFVADLPRSYVKHNLRIAAAIKDSISPRIRKSDSYSLLFSSEELLLRQQEQNSILKNKKILFWTRDNEGGRTYAVGLGDHGFREAGCPVWQCEVYDREMKNNTIPVEEFDAVVFHDSYWKDKTDRPAIRSPHQRYVLWTREIPGNIRKENNFHLAKNFINWTITHRWDSDIVHPYGWITPYDAFELMEQATAPSAVVNYAEGKSKLIAWFVSNCNDQSGRMEYVDELSKFINVDIYGKCGNLSCPKSDEESCRSMLNKDYKFYLSFENSLCIDYVTEKFFAQMKLNIIPVVLDLHGNHAQFAPPHSYINALDFPSVKALADYLTLLDGDDVLYNQYFEWKKRYAVHDHKGSDFKRGFCHLCSLLHRPNQPKKVYPDLKDWLYDQADCKILRLSNDDPNIIWTTEPLRSITS